MGQFTNLHSEKYTNFSSGNPELFFRKHNYVQETPLVRKTFGRRPLAEPLAEPLAVEICFSFRTDTRWSSYSNEPRPQTRSSNPLFPVLNWFLNKTSETDIQSLAELYARDHRPDGTVRFHTVMLSLAGRWFDPHGRYSFGRSWVRSPQ